MVMRIYAHFVSLIAVWGLTSLIGLSALVAHAAVVEIPPLQAPVTDMTQTLSAQELATLNQKLSQFALQSGAQIAVLLLPSTQPEDIAQFGIRVAEAWKVGRAQQDDGVIVIVAKQDRKMRIEVGYGLEGAIPDAVAKRLISEQLAPAFKQGQFYAGLQQVTDSLSALIQGEHLPPPQRNAKTAADDWFSLLPLLMFAAILGGAIFKSLLGDLPGSLLTGGLLGAVTGLFGATALVMALVALAAFIFTLAMGGRGGVINPMGSLPGGWGGSAGGPDVFSGGGGGFGGGGASGDW